MNVTNDTIKFGLSLQPRGEKISREKKIKPNKSPPSLTASFLDMVPWDGQLFLGRALYLFLLRGGTPNPFPPTHTERGSHGKISNDFTLPIIVLTKVKPVDSSLTLPYIPQLLNKRKSEVSIH